MVRFSTPLRLIVASSDRNPEERKKSHNCLRDGLHRAWFQTFGVNAMAQIRKGTILEVDNKSTPTLTHSGLNKSMEWIWVLSRRT